MLALVIGDTSGGATSRLSLAKRVWVELITDCRDDGVHLCGRSSQRLSGHPSTALTADRHGVML